MVPGARAGGRSEVIECKLVLTRSGRSAATGAAVQSQFASRDSARSMTHERTRKASGTQMLHLDGQVFKEPTTACHWVRQCVDQPSACGYPPVAPGAFQIAAPKVRYNKPSELIYGTSKTRNAAMAGFRNRAAGALRADVCPKCIVDEGLQEFIRNNATSKRCTYCGRQRSKPFACSVGDVVQNMARVIREDLDRPG